MNVRVCMYSKVIMLYLKMMVWLKLFVFKIDLLLVWFDNFVEMMFVKLDYIIFICSLFEFMWDLFG